MQRDEMIYNMYKRKMDSGLMYDGISGSALKKMKRYSLGSAMHEPEGIHYSSIYPARQIGGRTRRLIGSKKINSGLKAFQTWYAKMRKMNPNVSRNVLLTKWRKSN
jgi:hypothetical protein